MQSSRATPSAYDRADEIAAQRDQLVAELRRLETADGPPADFAAKARDLLTRAWAKADWKGRQDLLKAAQWMVHLGTTAMLTGV